MVGFGLLELEAQSAAAGAGPAGLLPLTQNTGFWKGQ